MRPLTEQAGPRAALAGPAPGVFHRGGAAERGALHQFAESLGLAVDAKDPNTRRHSEEVAVVARALALGMGLSPWEADVVHVAAHLHDIGKIGIPDAVLFKCGPLTAEEWTVVEQHPTIGAAIAHPVPALRESGVEAIIRHHHERFDGGGYPDGLSGTHIPLGARIVALADTLSAMLQHRPYRPALTFRQASMEILAVSGTQLDPSVAAAFFRIQDEVEAFFAVSARGQAPSAALA
ncbi:MAG: HD-GYP domain-containing protein [Desulfovibrionaceae bacterium]